MAGFGKIIGLWELIEIVRQSSDPDFTQFLNRVREGKHTEDDVTKIKALANTDTYTWPDEVVLSGQE